MLMLEEAYIKRFFQALTSLTSLKISRTTIATGNVSNPSNSKPTTRQVVANNPKIMPIAIRRSARSNTLLTLIAFQ